MHSDSISIVGQRAVEQCVWVEQRSQLTKPVMKCITTALFVNQIIGVHVQVQCIGITFRTVAVQIFIMYEMSFQMHSYKILTIYLSNKINNQIQIDWNGIKYLNEIPALLIGRKYRYHLTSASKELSRFFSKKNPFDI